MQTFLTKTSFKKVVLLDYLLEKDNWCAMEELRNLLNVTEKSWIWVNTSDTICENFFEIPAGEYLIVSTSGQTKTVWPLIEAMKLKPCGNLAKKM